MIMASSLVKIDIHIIFHVKNNGRNMRSEDLPRIFQYIGGVIRGLNAIPIEIGGMSDHIHILTSLPKAMPLTDFVRDIKSNSSKWIKQQHPDYKLFAWQDGYAALSVSPGILDKTISYIRRQNEHHQKRSFEEEYKMFLEHYGIAYNERYVISD